MLELMLDLNQELNTALVVVTHDLSIAERMQYRWHMQDGILAPGMPYHNIPVAQRLAITYQ